MRKPLINRNHKNQFRNLGILEPHPQKFRIADPLVAPVSANFIEARL